MATTQNSNFQHVQRQEDASLFSAVWGLALRRKGLIGFGLATGLGLGCLYYFLAAPRYESKVQILVMQKDTRLPTQGVERDRPEDNSASNDILPTHVQLFRSPRIINQAIEKHNLEELPSFVELRRNSEQFNAAEYISRNLVVTKGGEGHAKEARVLRAAFQAPSAEDCATVLSALVESYQDFLAATFQGTSSEALRLISQAKAEQEGELKNTEEAYRRFREQSPLLSAGDQKPGPHQDRLREIEAALTAVRLLQTGAKTRLEVIREALASDKAKQYNDLDKLALIGREEADRISLMLAATRGDATNSEVFQSKQPLRTGAADAEFHSLFSLVLRERELLQDFGEDHPEIQKIRKQIEVAKEYLSAKSLADPRQKYEFTASDVLTAHVGLLEHDVLHLQKRENQLAEMCQREREAVRQLVSFEVRDEIMRADVARKRSLYEAVIDRVKNVNLIKDYGGYITQVICPVETPRKAVSPILALVLGLGGILGLLAGSGLAYVVDVRDRTFRSPDEVQRTLGLPLLAEVPPMGRATRKAPQSANGKEREGIDPMVAIYHRPASREAEAIRGLRAAFCFSTRRGGQKVIQITSPHAKDGKTTMAANLALSLAQSGRTVLLVDADFRSPAVHRVFGIDASLGLSSIILDRAELSDAIQEVGIENLSILPAGPRPSNPSDLLTSARFDQFLELARERYDYVIIDSPSLLGVSDPSVIAPRADGVLLTIRITKNGAPAAAQAKRMLAAMEVNTLGVVVNGFEMERSYQYGVYESRGYEGGYDGAGGDGKAARPRDEAQREAAGEKAASR